jgi:F-type H+-transporting ATPase subunit epsilon
VATFPFEVVTPERTLLEGDAEMVTLRSAEGDIAFLAGHVPYIGAVRTCLVRAHRGGGQVQAAAVHGGFVEVADGRLTLLAGVAEVEGEVDVERARRALASAESSGDEAARRRAEVRLELAGASG